AVPKVVQTTNGRHVANQPVQGDPQFANPTVTVLQGLPVVNKQGARRSDTVELSWTTVRNPPFVFAKGLNFMRFGAQVKFDGKQATITGAEWSRANGPPIDASPGRARAALDNANNLDFSYTNLGSTDLTLTGVVFQ